MNARVGIDRLREWIGRSETWSDMITERLVSEYLATLGNGEPAAYGQAVPAGLHWCLAPTIVPLAGIGPDGHPQRGGLLPPVPLPRRMWAGSRVSFGEPLGITGYAAADVGEGELRRAAAGSGTGSSGSPRSST